jgi:hypothetical protein
MTVTSAEEERVSVFTASPGTYAREGKAKNMILLSKTKKLKSGSHEICSDEKQQHFWEGSE